MHHPFRAGAPAGRSLWRTLALTTAGVAAIASGIRAGDASAATLPNITFDLRVHGTGGKEATVTKTDRD